MKRTAAVSKLKDELKSLESLKRPVQEIMRYTKEVDDLTREIARYEAQLGESGGTLSGAEIRTKMDSLNEQRTKLQREQKMLAAEKDKAKSRIQGLKEQITQMKFRLSEAENKVNAKTTFARDLEEARDQLRKAQEEIKVLLSLRGTDEDGYGESGGSRS
jgi:chromosome segregation ATPase